MLSSLHIFELSAHSYSVDLLAELLGSSELYVMQVEMDVYTLAKRVSSSDLVVCIYACVHTRVCETSFVAVL